MEVIEWLKSQDGQVNPNLVVKHTQEQGNHILGSSSIKSGELLIQVPAKQLINVKTLGEKDQSHFHLAKYLYETHNPWTDSIPSIELPVSWSPADIQRLPPSTQSKVLKQQNEINNQFKESGFDDYKRWVWAWSSVNSRCLYWDVGLDREDQMTLAPLIDFFNHSTDPSNCIQIKNKLGRMCAYAPPNPTTELNLFYGPHDNAFLLAEYGFVAAENQWDHIDITHEICSLPINKEALTSLGYLGDYTFNSDGGPCFRTMVALASMNATAKQTERYANGIDDIPSQSQYIDQLVQTLRARYVATPGDRPEVKALYEGYQQLLSK